MTSHNQTYYVRGYFATTESWHQSTSAKKTLGSVKALPQKVDTSQLVPKKLREASKHSAVTQGTSPKGHHHTIIITVCWFQIINFKSPFKHIHQQVFINYHFTVWQFIYQLYCLAIHLPGIKTNVSNGLIKAQSGNVFQIELCHSTELAWGI